MAKQNVEPEIQTPNLQDINVSGGDLLKVIALLQKENAQVLADALAKLQPGYVSPEQKQFNEKLRQDARNIEIMKIKRRKLQQRNCQHEIGQTGNRRTGEGAFCGLKLPTGEMIGVCQYCQKVISSANPEDQKYFNKINGTPAEAGQVSGLSDPIKSQLARLSPDQREKVQKAREKYFATESAKDLADEDDLI